MPARDASALFFRQLQARDAGAWREAFAQLYPIAWRGTGNWSGTLTAEDREEVAVDALATAAQRIEEFDTWEQVQALVFVVARRRAVSRWRAQTAQKRQAAAQAPLSLEMVGEGSLPAEDPEALKNWAELAEVWEQICAGLNEPARALLRAYLLEGASYEELARRHGLTVGAVGVILFRTFQRLRRTIRAKPKLLQELSLYLRFCL